jgi:hypothetical protein
MIDKPLTSGSSRPHSSRPMLPPSSISSDRPHQPYNASSRNLLPPMYHTPVSPLRATRQARVPMHLTALMQSTGTNNTGGRRRSATVTANGRDDRDHPGATVHLRSHPYHDQGDSGDNQKSDVGCTRARYLSPSPAHLDDNRNRDRDGDGYPENVVHFDSPGPQRSKRYRLSPSPEASHQDTETTRIMGWSREEWMTGAGRLWDLFERVESSLARLEEDR